MRAIVTGASSGLGRELAIRLEKTGCTVVGTTHRLNVGGLKYLDFLSPESYETFAREQLDSTIDILINNAGHNDIRPFKDLDERFTHEMMHINCIGPSMLVKRLLKPLQRGRGIVCNIISDAAWRPMRHSFAYNCSKAAMAMATRQMARELTKEYGLTIFGVNPGKMSGTEMSRYIDNRVQMIRGWTENQAREYYRSASVNGKESNPEQVACTVIDLVMHARGNQFLSGAVIDLVG